MRALGGLVALTLTLVAVPALAQGGRSEAHERFERALQLYEEERFDAALADFEQAYEIAPSYRVLFNIAQVHARLGHAVEAVDTFERYLAEGGRRIGPDRHATAERELEVQRGRVAELVVGANVEGAVILVDGVAVGQTPLSEPIRLAAGNRTVRLSAPGYEPAQHTVTVAGQTRETVRFELRETGSLRGALRVTSPQTGVEILLDGELVGQTPLDGTLSVPPGAHEVRARRPGYVELVRTIEVGANAEAELTAALALDPRASPDARGRIRLELPPVATVYVDGSETATDGLLDLPVGPHQIRVEVPHRIPDVQDVVVEARGEVAVDLTLRWVPEVRQERLDARNAMHTAGVVLAIGGGLLLAGGAAVVIWNETRRDGFRFEERRPFADECDPGDGAPPMMCDGVVWPAGTIVFDTQSDLYEEFADAFQSDVDDFNLAQGLGWAVVGLGAASIVTSVILFVAAPSVDDEEAARDLRLEGYAGPGGVGLRGAF